MSTTPNSRYRWVRFVSLALGEKFTQGVSVYEKTGFFRAHPHYNLGFARDEAMVTGRLFLPWTKVRSARSANRKPRTKKIPELASNNPAEIPVAPPVESPAVLPPEPLQLGVESVESLHPVRITPAACEAAERQPISKFLRT